jgi:glycosyltransferase involved in cell wall biosynthesis
MRRWKILHVESGTKLLGGAQQVLHLITGLDRHNIENVLICSENSALVPRLAGVVRRVCEIPMRGDLDVRMAWQIARIAKEEEPDLIHLHSRRGINWYGGLAARWGGWPVVYTRRNDDRENPWVARPKYALFDRVVAISTGVEHMLRGAGVPAEKLRLVHSAIDPAPFAAPADRALVRRELGVGEGDLVVGMVAQFIKRKGHAVLLDALERLRDQFPHLRVLLFGDGPLQGDVARKLAAKGLSRIVRLLGFRDDIPRILPVLDLVVHPAYREGLGVALIQAAAAGVPIVACRAGGIPDIVRHEENGLLVEPGNVAGLAAAIQQLLADEPLRRRLGDAGRDLVARQFTYDRMVAGNLAVYRELLAPSVARAA